MSENVTESALKRCYDEIASPESKIPSPTFRRPAKKRNLTEKLEPDENDWPWITEAVINRLRNPKRSEQDAAIRMAMVGPNLGSTPWNALILNVEMDIITRIMENLMDAESKGKAKYAQFKK